MELWLDCWWGKRFVSLPKLLDWLWALSASYSMGNRGFFFGGGRGVQQLGHDAACSSHLVPRLQVDEGIPSLPCISAWCAKRQFYLYLHFIIRCGEMCQFITNMLQKWMWYSKCFTTLLMVFDVPKSVHHHKTQIIQPTRCNSFTSLLLDVYVWLDMFRAPFRPSSGAYNCTRSLGFYRWSLAVGALLFVVCQTTNSNALTVKPEASSAVVRS